MCAAAIGTDTAGSIRLPASLCGIVGFKPTYGTVSAEGVVPLSVSYDHVGPMTNTVADARTLFSVMSGEAAPRSKDREQLRIGIPEAYFFRDLEPQVAEVISSVMSSLQRAGHKLKDVDLPVSEDRTLSTYESFCYHREWIEKSPELYDPQTLKRIRSGEKTTPEQAAAASAELRKIRASAFEIFTDVDVLLTPTVPILPGRIDELMSDMATLRQRELLMLRNTRPFNVLGIPAISIPWDLARSGLPVGIQLATAPHKDFELLDIAEKFEHLAPWQGRTPPQFS
jgi:Asp-tRNA(Asn)/Glu-tRNA(Gln) amidotransferase A subunit family amidase